MSTQKKRGSLSLPFFWLELTTPIICRYLWPISRNWRTSTADIYITIMLPTYFVTAWIDKFEQFTGFDY